MLTSCYSPDLNGAQFEDLIGRRMNLLVQPFVRPGERFAVVEKFDRIVLGSFLFALLFIDAKWNCVLSDFRFFSLIHFVVGSPTTSIVIRF